MLSESQIVQSREAAGSGNNLIDQSVGGNGYNVNNVIDSSGSFSTSASTVASSTSIGLSQSLAGNGDLSTSIDGITASGSSSQISEVTGGALSTTQTLAAAGGVYAGQNTQLSGDAGGIGSSSSSAENDINLAGGFSGQVTWRQISWRWRVIGPSLTEMLLSREFQFWTMKLWPH